MLPSAPIGLAATVSGATVVLTWLAPATGGAPTSYVLQAGSASGLADLANSDTGSAATSLTAVDVPPRAYFVRVLARNAAGTSPPSNEIVVTVAGGCATAPLAPTALAATVSGSSVALAWQAPAGGCPATAYVVQAGSAPGLSNLANISTGSPSTTFAASGVGPGLYFVRVLAVNAAGVSGPSNEVPLTVGGCVAPPGPPGDLAASTAGSFVQLAWAAAAGAPTGYVVMAGSSPGLSDLAVIPTGSSDLSFAARDVPPGTYFVRVAAVNGCGTGPASNEVTLVVTAGGGPIAAGSVFRIRVDGAYTVMHRFDDGLFAQTALVQASDGNLYGEAQSSPVAPLPGAVFRISLAGDYARVITSTAHVEFSAPLIQASDGNLYGATEFGGPFASGEIFRVTLGGASSVVYSFTGGADGRMPVALLQMADGSLAGAARLGGELAKGTIFRLAANGAATPLHAFAGGDGGAFPTTLIRGADGNLYGTADTGGAFNNGIVFSATAAGAFTVLHSFRGGDEGTDPNGFVQAADGSFYGTTLTGGTFGSGTVFRMTPDGSVTVLHAFGGVAQDALTPVGIMQARDGLFYGTTLAGGSANAGTVFRMTGGGAVTILHAFTNAGDDRGSPLAPLVQASDGNLYGTTQAIVRIAR